MTTRLQHVAVCLLLLLAWNVDALRGTTRTQQPQQRYPRQLMEDQITPSPTYEPTESPTEAPTRRATMEPTREPTPEPTPAPVVPATAAPTDEPVFVTASPTQTVFATAAPTRPETLLPLNPPQLLRHRLSLPRLLRQTHNPPFLPPSFVLPCWTLKCKL